MQKKLAVVTYLEKNSTASKQNTAKQFNIIPKQLSCFTLLYLMINKCK
ncbi:7137_t:CDS:2 [Cetraspora pellucida]|uniref:7137_t:CDS:1 n=1 Tax=Cetraspora pellucida TaxID=1433469 RepID=A0ACA9L095_9GLOM|nr:7137_t:CDS:2 [Cetraspora pellucida]